MNKPREKSFYRTLLRITAVSEKTYSVVIPAIDPNKEFVIRKNLINTNNGELKPNQRFHAVANLNAKTTEQLQLSNFEF